MRFQETRLWQRGEAPSRATQQRWKPPRESLGGCLSSPALFFQISPCHLARSSPFSQPASNTTNDYRRHGSRFWRYWSGHPPRHGDIREDGRTCVQSPLVRSGRGWEVPFGAQVSGIVCIPFSPAVQLQAPYVASMPKLAATTPSPVPRSRSRSC